MEGELTWPKPGSLRLPQPPEARVLFTCCQLPPLQPREIGDRRAGAEEAGAGLISCSPGHGKGLVVGASSAANGLTDQLPSPCPCRAEVAC